MTALQILQILVGASAPEIVALLQKLASLSPDSAGRIQEILAELNEATGIANLTAVSAAVLKELGDIAQGRVDPRDHPSDGI